MGEACGRLILDLSDDDLWMPKYVATLRDLSTSATWIRQRPHRRRPKTVPGSS